MAQYPDIYRIPEGQLKGVAIHRGHYDNKNLLDAANVGVNKGIATTGSGDDFSVWNWDDISEEWKPTHPANTYDTFIPAINGSTSNPTVSYTEQFGDYALIDRLCHFEIRLNWQSISGGTGNIRIPLPFARHSNTANGGPAIAVMTGLSTATPIYACYSGFNNIGFRNAAGN